MVLWYVLQLFPIYLQIRVVHILIPQGYFTRTGLQKCMISSMPEKWPRMTWVKIINTIAPQNPKTRDPFY